MLPYASSRSFLISTLILSLSFGYHFAIADPFIVDDWDRTSLRWDGAWIGFRNEPPPTWDGTLTWGNLSGSTVTFTFNGTFVQVFGAFKPIWTWSMQSRYVIDGDAEQATTFVPAQEVRAESYNRSFYDSGALPAGEHTLTITNLGVQFWLDYFLVDDGGGGGAVASSTSSSILTSSASPRGTRSSATNTAPAGTSAAVKSTGSSKNGANASSTSPLNVFESVSSPTTNTSSTSTTSSPVPLDFPSSESSSSATSSTSSSETNLNPTATPRGAAATATQAHANTLGMSRPALVGLIVGVTIAGLVILAILLALGCRSRRTNRAHGGSASPASVSPYFFASQGPNAEPSSFRSQSSATLLTGPRLSRRRASSESGSVAGDLRVDSHADRARTTTRRSLDAGVSLAGGPGTGLYGGGGGDAPSISEAQSVKSRLPPAYQAYHSRSHSHCA